MEVIHAISFASLLTALFYLLKLKIKMLIAANQRANSIIKLGDDLWKLLSRYIRLKGADWKGFVYCFTCGRYENWKLVDAGHYIPKATSGSFLKFFEKNIHPQCQDCNRLKGGNYEVYKQKLIEKYGQGIIQELNSYRQKPPLTVTEYKDKIKHYTNQLKIINSK